MVEIMLDPMPFELLGRRGSARVWRFMGVKPKICVDSALRGWSMMVTMSFSIKSLGSCFKVKVEGDITGKYFEW